MQLLDRMRAVLLAAILWWTAVVNCDSSEDEISTGIRIVETREQRVCEDVHEDCAAFPHSECEENPRWMNLNCEKKCRRCVDHTVFLIGGNVTHLRKKAHIKAFKKRDGKSLVMFTHAKACKECTFAKPMFGKLAASGMEVTPDVEFAALDRTKLERYCVSVPNKASPTGKGLAKLPEFRFFGDAADWAKGGVSLGPEELMELKGLKAASDAWDDALFAYDGGEL